MNIKLSRITPADQNTIIDPSKLFTKNRKTENWLEMESQEENIALNTSYTAVSFVSQYSKPSLDLMLI